MHKTHAPHHPKKVKFNTSTMKAHGIDKFEFTSYENKKLNGYFYINENSKLFKYYEYQEKIFDVEEKVYSNYSFRKDCSKRNQINVIFPNNSFEISVIFYPINNLTNARKGLKPYPEYELFITYDEVMALLNETTLQNDNNSSKKELIGNEYFEIRDLKAIYVHDDSKNLSKGNNIKNKKIEVSCILYRKQMLDMYFNFFYCKSLKKSEFIIKEITKTKFYIYNSEIKSIGYIVIEGYRSNYGNARANKIFEQKILLKEILDNHNAKGDSNSFNTSEQEIDSSINNATKQTSSKKLEIKPKADIIKKNGIKKQIIENEQLKKLEEQNEYLKQEIKELKNKLDSFENKNKELVQDIHKKIKNDILPQELKKINEKNLCTEVEKRINQTFDDPKSNAMTRVKKTIKAIVNKELKKRENQINNIKTEVFDSKVYKFYLQNKQELEEYITKRLEGLSNTPIELSSSIQEALKNIELIREDFDIIYPDASLVDVVNDGMKKIGIEIKHLIIECRGINKESLINSIFQFDEGLSENQIMDMFNEVKRLINKQIRIHKKSSIETEEDVLQALTIIAEQLYDFIETNLTIINQWHDQNKEFPKALSTEKIMGTIKKLYKKVGIDRIEIRKGLDGFNPNKHIEMERKKDSKYGDQIITEELSPGYISSWTNIVLKKASVVVNYRW